MHNMAAAVCAPAVAAVFYGCGTSVCRIVALIKNTAAYRIEFLFRQILTDYLFFVFLFIHDLFLLLNTVF